MIDLTDVRFWFGAMEMRFTLTIKKGEMIVVFGPSGAGKSTLLNLIAGFEEPAGGQIILNGRDVRGLPPSRRPVTSLFQEHNLFPHLTVGANIGLGINPGLRLGAGDRQRVGEALLSVGLKNCEDRLPGTLSGGERQRVALARCLVSDRPILLLDEPFAALGPAQRHEMADLVHQLKNERDLTVIMVSHMPDEAGHLPVGGVFMSDGCKNTPARLADLLGETAPEPVRRYLGTRVPPCA